MNVKSNRGGLSRRSLGACLAALVVLLAPCSLFAAESGKATTRGAEFGEVWRIRGEVSADSPKNGSSKPLKEGDKVFVGEHLRASATGEAVIKTLDAGILAVRPGGEVVTERFLAKGEAKDNWGLRLLKGSIRVVTGWIGRVNRSGYRVATSTATIGIRGTDHEPYVLAADTTNPAAPADTASAPKYRSGTYDKVNRGATILEAAGKDLEIEAGKVGFAREATPSMQTRGLMTILFPVLLEKVPDFYLPGAFDEEIDNYSSQADSSSVLALQARRKQSEPCIPKDIARAWVKHFDEAIVHRDAKAILGLFAPGTTATASVRGKGGKLTTVELGSEEFVNSTIAAMADLSDYRSKRLSLNAWREPPKDACKRIGLRSVVVESGTQAGKAYNFESTEEFHLEMVDGNWLAVSAKTTQR